MNQVVGTVWYGVDYDSKNKNHGNLPVTGINSIEAKRSKNY